MRYRLLLFIALLFLPILSRSQDASRIIDDLVLKMNKVKDYSVQANIRSDIPLIKIMPVNATIYFKQKDKFRVVTKGIAVLPKQGFTDMQKMLSQKDSYNAFVTGQEMVQNVKTQIITVLPLRDTGDLILAKIWVDDANKLVLKSQVTTRSNGTVGMDYTYGAQKSFGLPDRITFTVDVKKFKIPKGVATDINRSSAPPADQNATKTGKIFITLTNYAVNKGISDSVFKE